MKKQFKDFFTLIKKSASLQDFTEKFNKQIYTPSIDMSCMEYECFINNDDGKINKDTDTIRIHFHADKKNQHHMKFGMQCGISGNIILPLSSIFDGLTPISLIRVPGVSEIDKYSSKTDINGYYYSDASPDEGTIYDEHNTAGASIIMNTLIEAYGDTYVDWEIMSSTGYHSFCLYWEYNAYLTFYSHIINVIASNLGDKILAEYKL